MRTVSRIAIAAGLVGLVSACANDTQLIDPDLEGYERPVPTGVLFDPEPVEIGMQYDPPTVPVPGVEPVTPSDPFEPPPPMRIVAGYYDSTTAMNRGMFPSHGRIDQLTHLIFGFADVDGDSRCVLDPEAEAALADVETFQEMLPELTMLLGIRTWTDGGEGLHSAATDAEALERLASTCSRLVDDHGFDGVNVAFPHVTGSVAVDDLTAFAPVAGGEYVDVIATLEARMQSLAEEGRTVEVTVAVPPGPATNEWFPVGELAELVDWILVPAYDFEGDDDSLVRLVAPLYHAEADPSEDAGLNRPTNVAASVQSFLQAGMPAWKVVLGVTFDGRLYHDAAPADIVLYQPAGGFDGEARGLMPWRDLVPAFSGGGLAFGRDEGGASPYVLDVEGRGVATYEDTESLSAKRRFAESQRLAGMAAWSFTSDDDASTLLRAIHPAR